MSSLQHHPLPQIPNQSTSSIKNSNRPHRNVNGTGNLNGQPKIARPKNKNKRQPVKGKKHPQHFEDALSDIFLAASLIVLPMVVLSAVFIGLVYRWQVVAPPNSLLSGISGPFSESLSLVNNSQSLTNSYFIDVEATTLVTIASWTSTAVSFLPPWVMMLLSYPIAGHFWKSSQASNTKLPTPYQLWMLIDLSTGSYASLLNWIKYRISPSRPAKRDRSYGLLASTATAFTFCLILGILILLSDTWLHLTTTTVILQETQQTEGNLRAFSRALSPACQQSHFSPDELDLSETCTVNMPTPIDQFGGLVSPDKAYKTLFDISNETQVLSTEANGRLYSFYAPATIPQNTSYRASTIAMSTECAPITQACNLRTEISNLSPLGSALGQSTSLPYKCTSDLTGDLIGGAPANSFYISPETDRFFLEYFNSSDLLHSYNPGGDLSMAHSSDREIKTYFTDNVPAYFVIGAALAANPNIMSSQHIVEYAGMATFLLKCSARVMNITYSFSDGAASDVAAVPAGEETIRAVTNPFLISQVHAWDVILSGLRKAGLQYSMEDLAASFAETYSHAMMSLGVNAVVSAPALRESTSSERQITRMPKAPFFTLLALNFLYAVVGLVLAAVAFASKPVVVKPIQARLSGPGLVAALFEGGRAERDVNSIKELFEENEPVIGHANSIDRVALVPTMLGGLKFEKIRV